MKTVLLTLVTILSVLSTAICQKKIIANFDDINPKAFFGWDNQPEVVKNPDASGINTSKKVGSWQKSKGSWKACSIAFDPLDITTMPELNFNIYTPVEAGISVRIENSNKNETLFFDLNVTETKKWVNVKKDLTSLIKGKGYSRLVLFINPKIDDNEDTYLIDDIFLKALD